MLHGSSQWRFCDPNEEHGDTLNCSSTCKFHWHENVHDSAGRNITAWYPMPCPLASTVLSGVAPVPSNASSINKISARSKACFCAAWTFVWSTWCWSQIWGELKSLPSTSWLGRNWGSVTLTQECRQAWCDWQRSVNGCIIPQRYARPYQLSSRLTMRDALRSLSVQPSTPGRPLTIDMDLILPRWVLSCRRWMIFLFFLICPALQSFFC